MPSGIDYEVIFFSIVALPRGSNFEASKMTQSYE